MFAKPSLAITAIVILVAGIAGARPASAQSDSAGPLQTKLEKQYRLTKMKTDNGVASVIQPGAVLVIQQEGIFGVPPTDSKAAQTTYRVEKEELQPGAVSRTSRPLRGGEKVYVTRIDVDGKNDKVSLTIVECDACNSVQQPSSYTAEVVFQYPKDYLQGAESGQVQEGIDAVLLPAADIPPTSSAAPAGAVSTPTATAPVPSEAAPAQRTFAVRHRHINLLGAGSDATYYCSGTLSILADGTLKYDCSQTDDPSGRCEHASIPAGYLKQAKVGYNGLHLASKGQGNYDFVADPGTINEALKTIAPLAGIAPPASAGTSAPPLPAASSSCSDYESCMKNGEASLEKPEGGAEALTEFEKASRLDPTKTEPLTGKGYAYLQMAEYDHAVYVWDSALKLGSTLSISVCHAGFACGDTGYFLLSTKEVSFVNKKGQRQFAAAPSAVTSEVGSPKVLFANAQIAAYFVQLKVSGKNYRFYYGPKGAQCKENFMCQEPGLTQQKVVAEYVHNTIERLRAGSFVSQASKP